MKYPNDFGHSPQFCTSCISAVNNRPTSLGKSALRFPSLLNGFWGKIYVRGKARYPVPLFVGHSLCLAQGSTSGARQEFIEINDCLAPLGRNAVQGMKCDLPTIRGKGLVRFRHPMHFFLLLESATGLVVGVHEFAGEFASHGALTSFL